MKAKFIGMGAVLAVSLVPSLALAEYPERQITVIVTSAPGGTTDVGVRTWAPFLESCLGSAASVVVINKPGGGHSVGLTEIANSAPDGYTLGTVTLSNMPVTAVKNKRYDLGSFNYLGSFYASTATLATRKDGPIKSLKDVVEAGKDGKEVKIGLSSIASDDHFMGMRFKEASGLNITFVPFGDAAATRTALLGGHIDVASMSMTEAVPFLSELTILAVGSAERSDMAPDAPTFKEAGFDVVGGGRHVVGAPAGLPEDVRTKLSSCLDKIATDPEFQKAAKERSLILSYLDAAGSAEVVKAEYESIKQLWETSPWE